MSTTITDNIHDICDRLIETQNAKEIARGLKSLPDTAKTAYASLYVGSILTDSNFALLGRVQTELLKN